MKSPNVLLIFLILSTLVQFIKAEDNQFKVDCGRDTFFCGTLEGAYQFYIGSNVKLINGTPPYQYCWSFRYTPYGFTYSASNFLSDTTNENPYIKFNLPRKNKPFIIYLSVKDNNGNIASDSLIIQQSHFVYFLYNFDINIALGDSCQFSSSYVSVEGGIPPIHYYWSPSTFLDDSSRLDAWCKPSKGMKYYQYIIDSIGCKSNLALLYYVFLKTGINEMPIKKEAYQYGNRIVFYNPQSDNAKITIYSIDGKPIYSDVTKNSYFVIPSSILQKPFNLGILEVDNRKESIKIF
jgi:hypothetical protein